MNDAVEKGDSLPHIWAQVTKYGAGMTKMEVIGQERSAGTIAQEKKVSDLQKLFSEMIKHAVERSSAKNAKKPGGDNRPKA